MGSGNGQQHVVGEFFYLSWENIKLTVLIQGEVNHANKALAHVLKMQETQVLWRTIICMCYCVCLLSQWSSHSCRCPRCLVTQRNDTCSITFPLHLFGWNFFLFLNCRIIISQRGKNFPLSSSLLGTLLWNIVGSWRIVWFWAFPLATKGKGLCDHMAEPARSSPPTLVSRGHLGQPDFDLWARFHQSIALGTVDV